LLYYGAAIVRGNSTALPEKRFPRILQEKIDREEWFEVRTFSRYRAPDGSPRTSPRVLALTREYALELIRGDTGERYADFSQYVLGRALPPRIPRATGLPADIAAYLEAGTGLLPDHETALRVLYSGASLKGWRVLSLEPPGRELRTEWRGKPCGRFYSAGPNLQGLPQAYRLAALSPAGAGEGFAELDFRCCHPNIARALSGLPPEPDLYTELAELFGYTREHVKDMVTAIMHGRTRAQHVFQYGPEAVAFYDAIRGSLKTTGGRDKLFLLEGEILRGVLRRMQAAGIPSGLPVHDSLVTTEPGAVAGFMEAESERVLGVPLPVRITPAGPESLAL